MTPSFTLPACEKCGMYFEVYISNNDDEMRALIKEMTGYENEHMTGACARDYNAHGDMIGYIFYARPFLGAGYATHELAHAAFRALEAHGFTVHDEPTEERFCQTLEYMNAHFWRLAYANGFATQTQSS